MIHNDHLATPQKMTDASGVVVWSAEYKPFGEATVNPSSTITNNLRYPGQYYDAEMGTHYNLKRTFNTTVGRYVEADRIGIRRGANHLYLYAKANPLRFMDPYGLLSCIYVTDSHTLTCVNNDNQSMSTSLVVSGNKKCKNDPACRDKKNKGPLPPGTYGINPPGDSENNPTWLYLPPNDVELGTRDGGFYIHPGSYSEGCVVILKANMADFNKVSDWAIKDGGGTLIVISTSDPIL